MVKLRFAILEQKMNSQYIRDILELLLTGDNQEEHLMKQVSNLDENEREYTSQGVYITFAPKKDISCYKISDNSVRNGIEIQFDRIIAEANLFLKDGIIDYLEIVSLGDNYPHTDPKHYKLIQIWNSPVRKSIER